MNSNFADDFAVPWTALCRRAAPNVFMSPAAAQVVQAQGYACLTVLPAWLDGDLSGRLIGFWALQLRSLTPVGPAFLSAPPYQHAFMSNPVLDPEYQEVAMNQLMDTIEQDERLPKVLRLRYLDADCPSYAALMQALQARGAKIDQVSRHERPVATKAVWQSKAAGSTRKKLRQKWRRLATLGKVEILHDPSPAAVHQAFEVFLQMEHASWKGSAKTSLLSDARDAAFARQWIGALSQDASASVALLTLDRRPIAAQVLLHCGTMAYTWKTAFDSDFGAVSPGALLADKITEQLFGSGTTESIESCSPEGSFLNQLWSERRSTVEVVAHLGSRQSLDYAAVAMGARSRAHLREIRDKLRDMTRSMLRGRGASVANNP